MCSMFFFFFFYCYGDHRDLHSFPTRRSSDLSGRPGLDRETTGQGRRRTQGRQYRSRDPTARQRDARDRSEEHTSELQSRQYLVCRLLLEKKKKKKKQTKISKTEK